MHKQLNVRNENLAKHFGNVHTSNADISLTTCRPIVQCEDSKLNYETFDFDHSKLIQPACEDTVICKLTIHSEQDESKAQVTFNKCYARNNTPGNIEVCKG